MTDATPIALFVYRRPDHARRVVSALAACPEAAGVDLTVFSDGPREPEQNAAVEETRAVIRSARGFRSVRLVERAQNIGLFQNVLSGLNETFTKTDRLIVLEDDIEVRPDFLSFMNAALDHYASYRDVSSITGYLYPAFFEFPDGLDSFLFPRFCCWGWATWKDRWEMIDWRIPSRSSFTGTHEAFHRFWSASNDLPEIMLDLIDGKNSSWSILFNYWQVQNNAYCVYPTESKARNIGFDGTGTHGGSKEKFRVSTESEARSRTRSTSFQFADRYDELVARPLASYFRNGLKRKVKNLFRYGRLF